jgi:O-antigen ligase
MGMNGFRQVVHVLYPLMTISPTFDIGHAHNHILQAGLDLGFLGLIAYLSIWIICLALLWNGLKIATRQSDRVILIGLSGSLAAGWTFGVFDAIALGARPGFLWWLLIALLMSTYENIRLSKP